MVCPLFKHILSFPAVYLSSMPRAGDGRVVLTIFLGPHSSVGSTRKTTDLLSLYCDFSSYMSNKRFKVAAQELRGEAGVVREELPGGAAFLWFVVIPTHSHREASTSHLTLHITFLAFSSMSPDSTPGPRCPKSCGEAWGWDGGGAEVGPSS